MHCKEGQVFLEGKRAREDRGQKDQPGEAQQEQGKGLLLWAGEVDVECLALRALTFTWPWWQSHSELPNQGGGPRTGHAHTSGQPTTDL